MISNPSSRGTPMSRPPRPTTIWRRARSFMSITRRQRIWRTSRSTVPWNKALSSIAASRLWAAPTAWMSPVKCRLMSSIGNTCERPPPHPPPFTPNTGPIDGSRMAIAVFLPRWARACPKPTVVVVFPSPAGVGLIAETRMSLPGRGGAVDNASSAILALKRPYGSRYCGGRNRRAAISSIGFSVTA